MKTDLDGYSFASRNNINPKLMKTQSYNIGRMLLAIFGTVCTSVAIAQTSMVGPNKGLSTAVIANSTNTWQNTANLFFCDNRYASVSLLPGKTSDTIEIDNFKFNVPTDAIITGVTVTIKKGATSNGITDNSVKLLVNNKVQGIEHARKEEWSKEPQVITYGGENDLWGTSITSEIANSYDFGVALSVSNSLFSSDSVKAEIDYISVSVNYKKVTEIDMLSFNAVYDDGQTQLDWTMAANSLCTSFTVQRTPDGLTSEDIGNVHAVVNADQTMSYSFTDSSPLKGTSYYRIMQHNADGTTKSAKWVAVSNNLSVTDVQLYPNPADDILTVKFPASSSQATLMVMDVSGKMVMNKTITAANGQNVATFIQDISGLSQGMYCLVVNNGDKNYTAKLIKK